MWCGSQGLHRTVAFLSSPIAIREFLGGAGNGAAICLGGEMKSARVFRPAFAKANKVDARREHDAARNKVRASRRWYGLKAWQVRRAEQLAREPLCSFCLRHGLTVAAMVADHVELHNDDWEMFISGELQSLCKPCHDSDKQRAERFAERMKSNRRS